MSIRLIIVIIMLVAAVVLGVILVWPKFQDFQQIQSDVDQKQSELDSKTSYYSKIKEIWSKLEEYKDVLTRIDSAFPVAYSVPALFYYLQRTTGETGLVMENLTLGGFSGERIKETDVTLQASGSYASLKTFLEALENSVRFFKVKNISFSSPDKGMFSFEIRITAYSY